MSAVARERPHWLQRWTSVVQLQGVWVGELLEVRAESGAARQVGQRRRWRAGRCEVEGGLRVQFYSAVYISR